MAADVIYFRMFKQEKDEKIKKLKKAIQTIRSPFMIPNEKPKREHSLIPQHAELLSSLGAFQKSGSSNLREHPRPKIIISNKQSIFE